LPDGDEFERIYVSGLAFKFSNMKLTTEELPVIEAVTEADIERIFADEVFGKFVILSASEDSFIQAASVWSPTKECAAFLQSTGSDPYCLEFRDGALGRLFSAHQEVTLTSVKSAFLDYLRGRTSWRDHFEWVEVQSRHDWLN
jgi:hypothetical protein